MRGLFMDVSSVNSSCFHCLRIATATYSTGWAP